jgi:DNA-binding LytR/AlgR family response regulator
MAGDGQQAVEQALALKPTLCFLDIRMPGLSGLEAARALAEDWPEGPHFPLLVFVTAYDQYAVQAFDQCAVDYLLKPVRTERLARTVEKLRIALAAPPDDAALAAVLQRLLPTAAGAERLRWVRASSGDLMHQIPIDEVLFFRADDKYTCVQTAAGEHLIRTPIVELAAQLDPQRFVQVHRSTLVNLDHLAGTRRDEASRLFLRIRGYDSELPVSRAYVQLFKAM